MWCLVWKTSISTDNDMNRRYISVEMVGNGLIIIKPTTKTSSSTYILDISSQGGGGGNLSLVCCCSGIFRPLKILLVTKSCTLWQQRLYYGIQAKYTFDTPYHMAHMHGSYQYWNTNTRNGDAWMGEHIYRAVIVKLYRYTKRQKEIGMLPSDNSASHIK